MDTPKISPWQSQIRLFTAALIAARHLGRDWENADYDPLLDPDVIAFIQDAVNWEVMAESQQVRELDEIDRELA